MMNPENSPQPGDRADSLLAAIGAAVRAENQAADTGEALQGGEDDALLIQNITRRIAGQQQSEKSPRMRRNQRRAAWATGMGVAAGLFLGVLIFHGQNSMTVLPAYAAEIGGVDREFRSANRDAVLVGSTARATLGNRLIVTLRPEVAVAGPVFASAWHLDHGQVRALDVPMQAAASGAVRLDAVVGDELKLTPGQHRIWLVVARHASTAAGLDLRELESPQSSDDHYVLPLSLEVLGR